MKIETTIELPEELLAALTRRAPDSSLRSELVAAAVRAYLPRLQKRDASGDLEIINSAPRS